LEVKVLASIDVVGEHVQLDGNAVLDCVAGGGDTVGMKGYPGSKAGSGVYQQIISQMPPHDVYVEPFFGTGAVFWRKRPGRINVGIDADPRMIEDAWVRAAGIDRDGEGCPGYLFNVGDGISYLQKLRCGPEWLIYCDPPYLRETRSSRRWLYKHELSVADHVVLIEACRRLPSRVMVSGYHCPLYDQALSTWRVVEYLAMTRGGPRTEVLWCNFREPTELHDYRYYGRDYRERERVGRKRARWLRRLSEMPVLERRLIESALLEVRSRGEDR
jgi:DNA adenine methylase